MQLYPTNNLKNENDSERSIYVDPFEFIHFDHTTAMEKWSVQLNKIKTGEMVQRSEKNNYATEQVIECGDAAFGESKFNESLHFYEQALLFAERDTSHEVGPMEVVQYVSSI